MQASYEKSLHGCDTVETKPDEEAQDPASTKAKRFGTSGLPLPPQPLLIVSKLPVPAAVVCSRRLERHGVRTLDAYPAQCQAQWMCTPQFEKLSWSVTPTPHNAGVTNGRSV